MMLTKALVVPGGPLMTQTFWWDYHGTTVSNLEQPICLLLEHYIIP